MPWIVGRQITRIGRLVRVANQARVMPRRTRLERPVRVPPVQRCSIHRHAVIVLVEPRVQRRTRGRASGEQEKDTKFSPRRGSGRARSAPVIPTVCTAEARKWTFCTFHGDALLPQGAPRRSSPGPLPARGIYCGPARTAAQMSLARGRRSQGFTPKCAKPFAGLSLCWPSYRADSATQAASKLNGSLHGRLGHLCWWPNTSRPLRAFPGPT